MRALVFLEREGVVLAVRCDVLSMMCDYSVRYDLGRGAVACLN